MNLQTIQQNRFVRNFLRDRWLILSALGIIVAFALVYALFFHKPVYKSTAKVWIKDSVSENYLTSGEAHSDLSALTQAGNPVLTQIEILESNELKDYLANYAWKKELEANAAKSKGVRRNPNDIKKPNTKKVMKVKSEPGTDVITVTMSWNDPAMAREMLSVALRKFDEINLGINNDIRTKKRQYIDERVAEVEGKLIATRNKIRQYQLGSGAIDLEEQTKELVRLKMAMTSRLEDVMAARNNTSANMRELQGQLAMSPREALKAVALGSGNENLVKMRTTLNELQQQYDHDSVRLAATNPRMVALKNQISTLQKQIQGEVRQTVGNGKDKGLRIYDGVRENLVQEMASSRARAVGLSNEVSSLSAGIARIDAALKTIPESKFNLDNLMQEEKALAVAYDELRKRQIEARIREAETPSNIFIVDQPSVPENASFPTATHVVALSLLLGLMAGLGLSVLKTFMEDLAEGVAAVEEATGSKVLGIIPWLPGFRNPAASADGGNVLSINDIAYKNIVSSLRIQSAKHSAGVIAFTSSALHKPTTSTAYTLAQRLAKMGHSVVLLDADFRTPVEGESLNAKNLTDLILEVDMKIRKGQMVYPSEIGAALVEDPHGVFLGLNHHEVDHGYDYFASKGFQHIVSVLKEQFDWVFIDTPSAIVAPEFLAVSEVSDGVVLFADKRATFSTLKRIARKVRETQSPLIGTIIREQNSELEREHREYTDWRRGRRQPAQLSNTVSLNSRRVEFMGAKIDALSMEETLERISEIIQKRQLTQHVVVNVAKLMYMQHDPELRDIVNGSGLINADGAGVVMGAKMLGVDIPERVTGIDLMQRLVDHANVNKYRIFFLGAEEDVVRDVVATYKRRYPGLQICGYRNGFFSPSDELAVAKQVRDARPDILFVAMSSPKKEKFINQYMEMMDVPFVMGVGGSFDVVAGKVRRAPLWMQNSGLEWMYRLGQEPGRMWKRYLVTNAEFGWRLANLAVANKVKPAANA